MLQYYNNMTIKLNIIIIIFQGKVRAKYIGSLKAT